ncbi:pilin [Psychrobacter sp. 28M-43]|uniref:pilin n=1 Tax=Psychrobacter sp. 28M-43 TaxID=2772254 RepID=UPI00168CC7DF|nr:prepilin-type N-terminal cleavage/methylation domain-containing protein [Psychrobacter sp. 28M-43]QOD13012.1 pilin [Psychrobacter sp. 28M-43]
MLSTSNGLYKSQAGFTLIEIMIVVAIISILVAIATVSYQTQVRKAQIMVIYQTMNDFRVPYQILINDGDGVTDFSPNGLNMPSNTKYCQFSVTAPNPLGVTINAIQCKIQNLSYLSEQTISLDRALNGSWSCRASADISKSYLPQDCQ